MKYFFLFLIFIAGLIPNLIFAQNRQIDQLIESAKENRLNGEFQMARENAQQALNLAKASNYYSAQVEALLELSIEEDDHSLQLSEIKEAFSIASAHRYPAGLARSNLELGLYYKGIIGDYRRSLEYFQRALNIRKTLKDSPGIASVYNNMASAYDLLKEHHLAGDHIKMAIAIYQKMPDQKPNLIRAYNTWANILGASEDKQDSSILVNKLALAEIKLLSQKDTASWLHAEFGLFKRYVEKYSINDAWAQQPKTIQLATKIKDTVIIGRTYYLTGLLNLRENNLNAAIDNLEKAKTILWSVADKDSLSLIEVFTSLGETYSAVNKFDAADTAFVYANHFRQNKIIPGETMDVAIENGLSFNKERYSRYWFRNAVVVVIFLILLFVIYLLSQNARERAEKITLKEKYLNEREQKINTEKLLNEAVKETLDHRALLLTEQEKVIKLKSVHHLAINNTLNTILAHLSTHSNDFDRFSLKNMIEESIQILKGESNESILLSTFVRDLWRAARKFAMMDVVFQYDLGDAQDYEVKGNIRDTLTAIVQLAFSNVRLHAQATKSSLNVEVDGNNLIMIINDNGKGFVSDDIRTDAIGLKDMETKAQSIGAYYQLDSQPNKGTTITIRVSDPFIL